MPEGTLREQNALNWFYRKEREMTGPKKKIGALATVSLIGSTVGNILLFCFKVLTLPLYPVSNRVSKDRMLVKVVSHDNLAMLWLLVPLGGWMYLRMSAGLMSETTSGWTAFFVGLFYLMAYATEVNSVRGVVILLVAAVILLASHVAKLEFNIPVLPEVLKFFRELEPTVGKGFWALTALVAALVIAFYALPRAFLVGRRVVSSRSVDALKFGTREDLVSTAGNSVSKEFKDIFETVLLLGGGSIVISERVSGREVMRIDNVFGLYFIFKYIEPLFQSTAVREDEADLLARHEDLS